MTKEEILVALLAELARTDSLPRTDAQAHSIVVAAAVTARAVHRIAREDADAHDRLWS